MEDAEVGEFGEGELTRLTNGAWTDTHCQWSPRGDWIVFASNRANPTAPQKEDLPDPGYFGIYLVDPNNPDSWVKVMDSGFDHARPSRTLFAGHVTHPCFSPDGKSLVVAADLAAVSCEPISLPLFSHSVRPYGDVFVIDLDVDDIKKNENLTKFTRLTHSRYENSTAVWTMFSTDNTTAKWNLYLDKPSSIGCPYIDPTKGESFLVTGHLCIGRRCC